MLVIREKYHSFVFQWNYMNVTHNENKFHCLFAGKKWMQHLWEWFGTWRSQLDRCKYWIGMCGQVRQYSFPTEELATMSVFIPAGYSQTSVEVLGTVVHGFEPRPGHGSTTTCRYIWWLQVCGSKKAWLPCHIHAYIVYTSIGGKRRCYTRRDLQDHHM